MKFVFGLTLIKFSSAMCEKLMDNWEDCRNWAAYMPGHYWTWAHGRMCIIKRECKTKNAKKIY